MALTQQRSTPILPPLPASNDFSNQGSLSILGSAKTGSQFATHPNLKNLNLLGNLPQTITFQGDSPSWQQVTFAFTVNPKHRETQNVGRLDWVLSTKTPTPVASDNPLTLYNVGDLNRELRRRHQIITSFLASTKDPTRKIKLQTLINDFSQSSWEKSKTYEEIVNIQDKNHGLKILTTSFSAKQICNEFNHLGAVMTMLPQVSYAQNAAMTISVWGYSMIWDYWYGIAGLGSHIGFIFKRVLDEETKKWGPFQYVPWSNTIRKAPTPFELSYQDYTGNWTLGVFHYVGIIAEYCTTDSSDKESTKRLCGLTEDSDDTPYDYRHIETTFDAVKSKCRKVYVNNKTPPHLYHNRFMVYHT